MKSLDAKLAQIRAGDYSPKSFIIADAKDGDMGAGLAAPGPTRDGRKMKTKADYMAAMTVMTQSGLVDIMLTSLSTAEALGAAKLFTKSPVTPAVRLNDTTDIWSQRGAAYKATAQRPYRTARLSAVEPVSDLGLYSVTFSNDIERDLETLEAYAGFRDELSKYKIRHFLEVFNPAFDIKLKDASMGQYANDCITRTLAGVGQAEYPVFLKLQYNGAAAMEELAAYDPTRLIVGVLGGAKGTTRDTFELAAQAEKYGARVALFGRKIYFAESALDLVQLMRHVIERTVTAADAVKQYHDILAKKKLTPERDLATDNVITDPLLRA